jgi:hypothetical protein
MLKIPMSEPRSIVVRALVAPIEDLVGHPEGADSKCNTPHVAGFLTSSHPQCMDQLQIPRALPVNPSSRELVLPPSELHVLASLP